MTVFDMIFPPYNQLFQISNLAKTNLYYIHDSNLPLDFQIHSA